MCTQGHFWLVFTVILTTSNNTWQCFYQSKTVDSFLPVNVLTTCKVWQCLTFKCIRYTLASISTFWLILTLAVTEGLRIFYPPTFGFELWNNCVQCWFPKWFWMAGQLIQNLVWIFPNGSTANTKPCLDTSKWWINGPSKTIWMDLNGSSACYQHCSNGITMCVQNQLAFFKVEILNGFKWSISRRVKLDKSKIMIPILQ